MTCVVCNRNSKTLNGLEKFGNDQVDICSACKSAYYRYCEEMFLFVLSSLPNNQSFGSSEIKNIIFTYLNNDQLCKNGQKFIYQKLCPAHVRPFCKICRLRVMILKLKSFPRLKKLLISNMHKSIHQEMLGQWMSILEFLSEKSGMVLVLTKVQNRQITAQETDEGNDSDSLYEMYLSDFKKINAVKEDLLDSLKSNEPISRETIDYFKMEFQLTVNASSQIARICHVVANNKIYNNFIKNPMDQSTPIRLQN